MNLQEAILKSLEEIGKPVTTEDLFNYIIRKNYYEFSGETPKNTLSSRLGDFIRKGDIRVKREKINNAFYYSLTKNEDTINDDGLNENEKSKNDNFKEKDLHILLSTFLGEKNIYAKTVSHEQSSSSKDKNQTWIHPDMVGVELINLKNSTAKSFLKTIKSNAYINLFSFEIKKEIKNDNDLKNKYFQAVSNSSWANYGYLVTFEIDTDLEYEMERLNASFGIGIIKLSPNPFRTKILYPAKYKELDFKTIDKLCTINTSFNEFIETVDKLINADKGYFESTKKELENLCDKKLKNNEIINYCKEKNIPFETDDFE
jgi:hypothetical protein